jgi:3',5'-cyclic AMP phosphodiesterase CpdA
MRLAVISDIHGNLRALEAVLADIRTRAVDGTVNLGDLAAGPLWPRETVELLDTLGLPTVRGNHDRWMGDRPPDKLPPAARFEREALSEAQRTALHALPATVEVSPEVLAVHGTPSDDSTYLTEDSHDNRLMPAARALERFP